MNSSIPLAERMRPRILKDFIGQEHLLGRKGQLRKMTEAGFLPSMIFWGPPGVGKTTLARILADETGRSFTTLSAISSGVKDVREVIARAENNPLFRDKPPVLFIDEIHRFSKAQQDSLLGAVERGTITLIGATTENPSFEVISALLSRCQVYTLRTHEKKELEAIIDRALKGDDILQKKDIKKVDKNALIRYSGGDARKLLNLIEMAVESADKKKSIEISETDIRELLKANPTLYDKDGEQHYDIISAFIKSVRGSDPQASVYWLARMIAGGEDPKFIARRLIILASEDIGLANPTALVMANNCFDAVNKIGMPEGRIVLSQCTVYLASSPKSNSSYAAINKALKKVEQSGNLPVPLHLRNAPTKLMKELGYGEEYRYAHDYPENFTPQEFLPDELKGEHFYDPAENERERSMEKFLRHLWKDKYR